MTKHMGNLNEAKQVLEENKSLDAIINPQPKKRIKLPLSRDINLIQSILDKKLEARTNQFKEKILTQMKTKYQTEIEAIHQKAVDIRKDAEKISKLMEKDSNGSVSAKFLHNSYSDGYFGELPESLQAAKDEELFEVQENNIPEVDNLKKEIEEYILNAKLGLAPLADTKVLLEKIDKLLI